MLFINTEEFFNHTANLSRLTREEEKRCARDMAQGDAEARSKLIQSYFPHVAAHLRRAPKEIQTLRTIYTCIAALEKGVDTFDFQQDSEPFSHHLNWRLRQCITRCIANRR